MRAGAGSVDEQIRERERRWRGSGTDLDHALHVAELNRAGLLCPDKLRLAAYCGDLGALGVLGAVAPVPLDRFGGRGAALMACALIEIASSLDARWIALYSPVVRALIDYAESPTDDRAVQVRESVERFVEAGGKGPGVGERAYYPPCLAGQASVAEGGRPEMERVLAYVQSRTTLRQLVEDVLLPWCLLPPLAPATDLRARLEVLAPGHSQTPGSASDEMEGENREGED